MLLRLNDEQKDTIAHNVINQKSYLVAAILPNGTPVMFSRNLTPGQVDKMKEEMDTLKNRLKYGNEHHRQGRDES